MMGRLRVGSEEKEQSFRSDSPLTFELHVHAGQ